LLLYLTITCIF